MMKKPIHTLHFLKLQSKMLVQKPLIFFIGMLLLFLANSTNCVTVEFLYYDVTCEFCPVIPEYYKIFLHNSEIIDKIQNENDYINKVSVNKIFFFDPEGQEKVKLYNLGPTDFNAIIINHEVVIIGYANETFVREVINWYINSSLPEPNPYPSPPQTTTYNFIALLALAFSLGFFETFSPCLITLLSFIVGYTIKETTKPKESFLQILIFGVGFLLSTALLGIISWLIFVWMVGIQTILTMIVCVFAIFFGFNSIGLIKMQPKQKNLAKKLAAKHVGAPIKIFFLGSIFYFLDPCIAPVLVSMIPLLPLGGQFWVLLLTFCIGAFIPFLIIGFFVHYISKLVRITYRHRLIINMLTGMILIGYATYLIFFHVIPRFL